MTALTIAWHTVPVMDPRPVIVTGVFDLLHVGHVRFLRAARVAGQPLVVGIESDERVRAWKGPTRPVNPAAERAELIAAIRAVDAVLLVDGPTDVTGWQAYADLLEPLAPWAFAFTEGDPHADAKRRAADRLGAAVREIPLVPRRSTTGLLDQLDT